MFRDADVVTGKDISLPSAAKSIHAGENDSDYDIDFWEPKPPKVLMEDPEAVPLELHAQIQMYATTE